MADENDRSRTDNIRIVGAREAGKVAGVDGEVEDDPFASWFEPGAGALVKPVTASTPPIGASNEEFHLPDWTSPPTGVVPMVIASDSTDLPTVAGPVFRGSASPMDEEPLDFDDLAEGHLNVGALRNEGGSQEWDDWPSEDEFETGAVDSRPNSGSVDRTGAGQGIRSGATPTASIAENDRPRAARRQRLEHGSNEPPRAPRGRLASAVVGASGSEDEVGTSRAPTPRRRAAPAGSRQPRGSGTRSGEPTAGVGGDRNMGQAVGIGVLLIMIGIVCFVTGPIPTLLLVTAVIGFAALELVGALHQGGYNPAGLVVLVGTFAFLWGPFFRGPAAYPYVIALLVLTTLCWFLFVHPGDQPVLNTGATLLATLYVGGLGSFATLMAGYPNYVALPKTEDHRFGIGLLVAAVISAVSYDVAGYFVGRSFGATPLGPTMRAASPNKTQEGLIAGIIVSIVVTLAFLGKARLPFLGGQESGGIGNAVVGLFALACAFVAPLGDLCESMIKRDLDVKDMSQTLPGHGGVLDRFDALLFVLPVAYFVGTTLGVG